MKAAVYADTAFHFLLVAQMVECHSTIYACSVHVQFMSSAAVQSCFLAIIIQKGKLGS